MRTQGQAGARPNGRNWRMLAIVSLGGCLEFYDFAVFVLFASVLNDVFFSDRLTSWLSSLQIWGLFATGYIFRPFGGLVLAHFGDIFGRRGVFGFSILLMTSATLGISLLPTYPAVGVIAPLGLLVLRALQGIAIGGEVPGAWVFASEHLAQRRKGMACGAICCGLALGIFLASIVATTITSTLSPVSIRQFGWRIPFLLGGCLGLVSLKLRRMLLETPEFTRSRAHEPLVSELPLSLVLRTQKQALILSFIATWILSACVVVLALTMPKLLQETYGFTHREALTGSCVSTVFLALGLAAAGLLIDWIGIRRFFVYAGLVLALATFVMSKQTVLAKETLYIWCAMAGISGAVTAGAPYLMVSAFPTGIRYTGVSFAYNIAYAVFGGLTPLIISGISTLTRDAHLLYLCGIGVVAMLLGAYLPSMPSSEVAD